MKFTATPTEGKKVQVLANGVPCTFEGQPVVCNKVDAPEILGKLNSGECEIADFYPGDDHFYGCPDHAAHGDEWFYGKGF